MVRSEVPRKDEEEWDHDVTSLVLYTLLRDSLDSEESIGVRVFAKDVSVLLKYGPVVLEDTGRKCATQ